MAFGNRSAATYDVTYRVNLGVFRAENAEAQALYERGVRGMSTEALKLSLAQDKLQVALAKTGGSSRSTARAELELRRVQQELAGTSARTAASLAVEERELSRFTRGAIAGSGAFRTLGRSIAFSSVAFLGSAGFVFALRSSITAAKQHEVVQGQLAAALKASGIEYGRYKQHIEDALRSQELLTGFTEEKTTRAFTALVRATGSVDSGLRALHIAGNIARGANIDLETATLKVVRAYNGQTRGLTALGLAIPKGVKGWEALTIAQNKYAGSSAAYAKTAQGAQDRFNIALHQTEITIGTALLPTVTKYLTKGADWLGQTKNQERVQKDVKRAIHDTGVVVHDLAVVFHDALDVIRPVVGALGGVEKVAKGLVLLKLASVVSGWATSFGTIGARATTAFATTTTAAAEMTAAVVADAGRIETALDTATRPRNIVITETTRGTPGAPGGPGGTTPIPFGRGPTRVKPGSLVERIGKYGVKGLAAGAGLTVGTGVLSGLVLYGGFVFTDTEGQGSVALSYDQKTDQFYAISVLGSGPYPKFKISVAEARKIDSAQVDRIEAFKRRLKSGTTTTPGALRGDVGHGRNVVPPPFRPDRGTVITTQLARTQGQTGPARVSALQAQVTFDDQYIRKQEGLLKTDTRHYRQHAQILQRLYAERAGAQSEIDSINATAASNAKAASDKAASARAKASREASAQAKRESDQAYRDYVRLATFKNTLAAPDALRSKFGKTKVAKTAAGGPSTSPTMADFKGAAFSFLQTLHGFDSQYASNVFPAGSKTVGGHTIIVNQHFPSPTPDRNREAIYVRHALQNAFQTA